MMWEPRHNVSNSLAFKFRVHTIETKKHNIHLGLKVEVGGSLWGMDYRKDDHKIQVISTGLKGMT